MLKKETKYVLKWAKRIKAIQYMGGKCYECQESNIYVLDFHHLDPSIKEFQISLVGLHKRWSSIKKEIEKCILLCRNCHIRKREITEDRMKIKQNLLKYKKTFRCSKCGFEDKSGTSLDFHHIKDKGFGIGAFVSGSSKKNFSFTDKLIKELDKCIILCRNCHTSGHINWEIHNSLKNKIYAKIETLRENQKIDENKVMLLRAKGLSAQKIASRLGYKTSSVEYYLFHKNNY